MSTESEFLSPQDIKVLTGGCAKLPDQLKMLEEHRIPHKVVGRRIIVSRHHVREWLAGRLVPVSRGVRLDLVK